MKPAHKLLLASVLFCLAADAPAPSAPTLDLASLVPAPAAVGSDEVQAELALVLQLQQSRTPEQIARAQDGNILSMASFAPVVGLWFTPEKLPRTAAFLQKVDLLTNAANNATKQLFTRPRPGDADPQHRIKPLFNETDPGYPSGHGARSAMYALLLANLLPHLKDPLTARGQQLGFDRVIAGMHFPSDITAGRALATNLFHTLLANPAFRTDLESVRAELQAAQATTQPSKK
jgi:acid phosphatase (class A)